MGHKCPVQIVIFPYQVLTDDINDNADFVDREQQELLQQAYVLVRMLSLDFPTIKTYIWLLNFMTETFFSFKDVKQQTIYEYHRVEINTTRIMSGSAFEFTPLPSKCPRTQDFDRFASLSSSLT